MIDEILGCKAGQSGCIEVIKFGVTAVTAVRLFSQSGPLVLQGIAQIAKMVFFSASDDNPSVVKAVFEKIGNFVGSVFAKIFDALKSDHHNSTVVVEEIAKITTVHQCHSWKCD